MKKVVTLLFVIALMAGSTQSFAQCTPNATQNIFLIPDTAADFAPAFTYMPYVQVLYVAVPTDTVIFGMPATFDSIVVTNITGLPSSITYTTSPSNGHLMAGTPACLQFSGTPTAAEIGTYNLTINTLVAGNMPIMGDTIMAMPVTGYTIKVLDSSSFGIYHPSDRIDFEVFQNSPNPFGAQTEIAYQSCGNEKVTIEIFDILGNCVYNETMVSKRGYNSLLISGSTYKPGIYMYRVSNEKVTFSRRMLVSNR